MTPDDALITLDQAAKIIPGADADTLKRLHRAGKLTCYRPGKAFLTTRADVLEAVKHKCRVAPKARDSGSAPPAAMPEVPSPTPPPGLSSTELANAALDSALTQATAKRKRR